MGSGEDPKSPEPWEDAPAPTVSGEPAGSSPAVGKAGEGLDKCQRLIEEAVKRLEGNNWECIMELIEEIIKSGCHNGYVVGRKLAGRVKDVIHRLWLKGNDALRRELLMGLLGLGISKTWMRRAIKVSDSRKFDNYIRRYVFEWDPTNNQVLQIMPVRVREVKAVERLLRRELGWNEQVMCMRMWRFINVNVNIFDEYGLDTCEWLSRLTANELSDTRWLGWYQSDLAIKDWNQYLDLFLGTTNAVSAIHFPMVLRQVKVPSIRIVRNRINNKELKEVIYYIAIPRTAWPWPLNKREAVELLREFNKVDLVKALAAMMDGDGSVIYNEGTVYFQIMFGKDDTYEANLVKEVLQQQIGIRVLVYKFSNRFVVLKATGGDAIQILEEILPHMTHPMRSLRARLILMYENRELSESEFEGFYNQTKYRRNDPKDPKRGRAIEALARAAPQTHTHGDLPKQ
jgi:hypothetical protein